MTSTLVDGGLSLIAVFYVDLRPAHVFQKYEGPELGLFLISLVDFPLLLRLRSGFDGSLTL